MSIHKALVAAKLQIGAIGKNKKNAQQGFYFRGIDDVYNALHNILAHNGIVTVPEVLNVERQERMSKNGTALLYSILTMKYTFYCEDGSSISAVVVGEGMDSGDKATNKAMAIAHKYALLQVFMVPTEDMIDPDSECVEVAPPELATDKQLAAIADYREAGVISANVCGWLDEHKNTLTAADAQRLIDKLKRQEQAA